MQGGVQTHNDEGDIPVTLCNMPQIMKTKYLLSANYGVLKLKMTLNIENWLWLPSYKR